MKKNICVLGGTGFVGYHVISQLAKAGYRVRVLARHRERNRKLLVLPTVEVISADIHDTAQLQQYFTNQHVVINLVGILNEARDNGRGFHQAHVELAQKVIDACHAKGIKRLLHMSALNADAANGPSYYLRSKGEAEDLAHSAANINVTSFRPSVIFGPADSFFNRFACLLFRIPLFFPLACANARFAPVFVEDVAQAIVKSVNDHRTYGQHYDLCGPKNYTLQQLVKYTAKNIDVHRTIIPLGKFMSLLQANIFQYFPGKPFSRDNYRSMQVDSICKDNGETLTNVFKITPTSIEAEVPRYLRDNSCRRRYDEFRQHAHRD
ncbi:MAG: complex I NDUFA9 subunit family protein [Gammaproteobacteria bacterium]|jgi:NADH dehydrogenase